MKGPTWTYRSSPTRRGAGDEQKKSKNDEPKRPMLGEQMPEEMPRLEKEHK